MASETVAFKNATSAMASKAPQLRTVKAVAATSEQTLGQYIPLIHHFQMLQDEDRVGAFFEAIDQVVRPGMHVVELGGGTGILSSFAARKGARVSCIERNPELVRHAKKFLADNGLADQVEVVQADAKRYVPNKPVDVVICEMLHVAMLREKQLEVINEFKSNYIQAGFDGMPLFVPELSMLMWQPIAHSFHFAGYHAPLPTFQAPCMHQPRTEELANFATYANIGYADELPMSFDAAFRFEFIRGGRFNAVRFATQNVLGVDMARQKAIAWPNQCLVLPIENPYDVIAGEQVDVQIRYSAGDSVESLWESMAIQTIPSMGG